MDYIRSFFGLKNHILVITKISNKDEDLYPPEERQNKRFPTPHPIILAEK